MKVYTEKLLEDIYEKYQDIDYVDLKIVDENYEDRGILLRFVIDEKHSFKQIHYSKNTYKQNLQNTFTIFNEYLEKKAKRIEGAKKRKEEYAENKRNEEAEKEKELIKSLKKKKKK